MGNALNKYKKNVFQLIKKKKEVILIIGRVIQFKCLSGNKQLIMKEYPREREREREREGEGEMGVELSCNCYHRFV